MNVRKREIQELMSLKLVSSFSFESNVRLQSALDEEEAKEGGKGADNAEKSEEPKAAEETATPAAETTEQSSTEEASEATKKPESESTSKTQDEGTKEEGGDQQSEVMEVDNKDGAAAKKEVSTIYGFSCVHYVIESKEFS